MTLREYLTSKVFFKQLALAFLIILVIGFLLLQWISFSTKHGEEITVPNLAKMSVEQAEEVLDKNNLDYVVLDTVDFNPDFPKFTVVKQDPLAGAKVKEDRKIYIKINSSGFNSVRVPNLIEQTLRQAVPTLKAIGLEQGKITYKPYLGKDMVIEMKQNGKILKAGDKVLKASKIDLVVGDGKVGFDEETPADSTATDTP
ncbi:MAG: PASTA domain-containing protein [Flavobacterium sp. BFFFF1]|uniref:PASTA domain-containing protein n=1 Tax=unclassified Flavobacterium TaxID=196869 RepID=UPI000BC49CA2|nr:MULTISPECIES: PASTA domain-containing protein [unclassified Flavobacterium]OYU79076.1 MAG: PASTA domain-containing protein [Flavobacterium sp. BFFFF1]